MRHLDPLFTFRLTPIVLRLLRVTRAEGRALLEQCGLPEGAADGVFTAPLSRTRRFLEEAAALHEGALGVALAKATPEGTYEMAELLVRTAPTLSKGLDALARYGKLVNAVGGFETHAKRTQVELHYAVLGAPQALGPQLNEFTIALVLEGLRRVTQATLSPSAVWFSHAATSDGEALEKHFGVPIQLGARTCGLAFAHSVAEAPLKTRDDVVHAFLTKQAEVKLKAVGARTFAATVVDCVESQVGFPKADLVGVCEVLGITIRTAQRRFREEGTSFREVIEEARARRAREMLSAEMPASSIAEALGFGDVRSFRRAAKRWTEDV